MLIGLLFGYVEAFGYLDRIVLGANTATIWESKSVFKSFTSWSGKRSVDLNLIQALLLPVEQWVASFYQCLSLRTSYNLQCNQILSQEDLLIYQLQ